MWLSAKALLIARKFARICADDCNIGSVIKGILGLNDNLNLQFPEYSVPVNHEANGLPGVLNIVAALWLLIWRSVRL